MAAFLDPDSIVSHLVVVGIAFAEIRLVERYVIVS